MEGNNQNVCDVCGTGNGRCGKCGHGCGFRGHNMVRWVLGIIIITWVFSIGMKFGEMTASYERNEYYGQVRYMPMTGASSGNVIFSSAQVAPAGTVTVPAR